MRVRYTGEFTVSRPPREVFDFLADPGNLARSFPGFKSVEVRDGEFESELRLSLGPLRGDARVRGRLVEVERPRRALVRGSGRGAGSTLDFTLEFQVEPVEGGSRVSWVFEGTVGGLAASMGARVLDPLARRLISSVVSNVKSRLEGGG